MALGADTHTRIDFWDKSIFKKPSTHLHGYNFPIYSIVRIFCLLTFVVSHHQKILWWTYQQVLANDFISSVDVHTHNMSHILYTGRTVQFNMAKMLPDVVLETNIGPSSMNVLPPSGMYVKSCSYNVYCIKFDK